MTKPAPAPAIPDAALDNHLAILGKTGAGKTTAAKGLVERLLDRAERVCIIDPTGVWYGLRANADGTPSGYGVLVFGGDHADLPLDPAQGEAIAGIVGSSSTPAIIDTLHLTVGERTKLFTAFATSLLRHNKGRLHLVIDEAHLFAPQQGGNRDPKSAEMLHAANNLVATGRGRGIAIIMISQRPAKLHKDSLSQAESLIAMRLTGPHDRSAVEDWMAGQAPPSQVTGIVSSLPKLVTGEALIWAPLQDVLQIQRLPRIKTFDSSRPLGADEDAPRLAPIDVASIRAVLEAEVETAIAGTKAKSGAKPRRAGTAPVAEPPRESTAHQQAAYEEGYLWGFRKGFKAGHRSAWLIIRNVVAEQEEVDKTSEVVPEASPNWRDELQKHRRPLPPYAFTADGKVLLPRALRPAKPARLTADEVRELTRLGQPLRPPSPAGVSPGPERKPLAALVAASPRGMTEAEWAIAAGFKRSGGTWSTYRSRLRSAGLIDRSDEGRWFATVEGIAAAGGTVEPIPPTVEGRIEFWSRRIGTSPARMLQILAETYPKSMQKFELANTMDMAMRGGTFGSYLSRLRSAGLIEDAGMGVRASAALMGPG